MKEVLLEIFTVRNTIVILFTMVFYFVSTYTYLSIVDKSFKELHKGEMEENV